MAIDSKIILALPSLPNDELSPVLFNELLTVYKALRNLLDGVSKFTGIDAPAQAEWSQATASNTILTGNQTRLYVLASVAINAGQIVNLFNNAGIVGARLASASSATTLGHCVATQAAGAGSYVELQWLRAFTTSIGGLTVGSLYYLSPVAGAVQDVAPNAVGTIQQAIGVAIAPSQLLLDMSLQFKQN